VQGDPPLATVKVLEITTSSAGQVAGMLLADLGADVVRVAGAECLRSIDLPGWLCWNRGKTLVTDSSSLVESLLPRSDILFVDASRKNLIAAGLDAASVRARAPSVVDVWMPSIAPSGRWSELPHDQLLLDAIGGFAAHHPATEERPVASVVPTRHLVQGALAAVAALSGLLARDRDGWGRSATVSGLHAEAATLNTLIARSIDGPPLLASGKFLPGSPNFRMYQGGDGRWFFLAALSPDLFIRALEVIDRLDILADPEIEGEFLNILRPGVGISVGAQLQAALSQHSTDEWLIRFAAAGVPAAPLSDPDAWLQGDVIAHASPPARRQHPELGEVVMPGSPLKLELNPPGVGDLAAPAECRPAIWVDVEPRPRPRGQPPGPNDRPLAGLQVIDLATFLAGPFVSTLLAYHGAEVIKVESPHGDPYSVFSAPYSIINEHKTHLKADLNEPAARALFLNLVGKADVVVDNLLTSSLARLDLGPERFGVANPNLVRCSVTAFGSDGPYAELPGFDPIMQTLSGLAAVQGGSGSPVATTAPVHDIAMGCVGALGTLAALWVRRHHGYGQRVFTSLAAISTYLQSGELTTYVGRPERAVGGVDFSGPSFWQRFYRAADRWIAVSATNEKQRTAFLEVLRQPELDLLDDGSCADVIAAIIEQRSSEEWVKSLASVGVPSCHAINRVELDDPVLVEHRYSHVVDTPHVGQIEIVSGYTDWDHVDRRPPLAVEHRRDEWEAALQRWSQ
jgi:crotonobetainyl-CoA:carnitine CoA-transferase CaiB-like acyl-CoA transferase